MQGAKITAHIPTATAGQQQQVNFYHLIAFVARKLFKTVAIIDFFLVQLIQLQQQVPGNVLPSVATIVQAAAHSIASRPGNVSFQSKPRSNERNSNLILPIINTVRRFFFCLASTDAANRKSCDCIAVRKHHECRTACAHFTSPTIAAGTNIFVNFVKT